MLITILNHNSAMLVEPPSLLITADNGYISRELNTFLTQPHAQLPRPSSRNRTQPNTCSNQSGN